MLTKEDLQAISDLMDIKLEPVNNRLERLEQDVAGLKKDFAELKVDVAELKEEVSGLKKDVAELKEEVSVLKKDVSELKEDVAELKESSEITRDVTNSIGEWIDYYFHDDMPYPLGEDAADKYSKGIKFAK